MKESEFNRHTVKMLKKLGHFAYKTADRYQVGIPDIYCDGGCWIEGKIVNKVRDIKFKSIVRPSQYTRFNEINERDRVMLSLYFKREKLIMLVPWYYVRNNPELSEDGVWGLAQHFKDYEYHLQRAVQI